MIAHGLDGRIETSTAFDLRPDDRSDPIPVRVHLLWAPEDPAAVELTFCTGRTDAADVAWFVDRDLIAAGLVGPAGLGDFQMCPLGSGDRVRIVLDTPAGHAVFHADADDLDDFLAASFARCPAGREYACVDVDAQLALLLATDGAP